MTPEVTAIGLVVRELEPRIDAWARLLGLTSWELAVHEAPAGHVRGRRSAFAWRSARAALDETTTIELIEPLTGDSVFRERLLQRGEGVHHLALDGAPHELDALRARLRACGATTSQRTPGVAGGHEWFDTRVALGGFELALPDPDAGDGDRASRERRTVALGGEPWLAAPRLVHLGVVVRDVFATLDRYAALLGMRAWAVDDWRAEPGSLDAPVYDGRPVDHAYVSATASLGRTGFEIVQPTRGPSHYREDFLVPRGEGVHHLYLAELEERAAWEALHDRMPAHDLRVAMGAGLLGGVAEFCYVDAAPQLGVTVELSVLAPGADAAAFVPAFTIDYGDEEVAA